MFGMLEATLGILDTPALGFMEADDERGQ